MPPTTNVLLITIDSLRADHLGFMGYRRPTSPNLDQLAEESVVFTNAFATGPRTPESFPGIMASADPLMYGGGFGLNERHTPLAEILRNAGYVTGGFHSNPYLSTKFQYQRGFDTYCDPSALSAPTRLMPAYRFLRRLVSIRAFHLLRKLYRAVWSFSLRLDQDREPFSRASAINKQAMRWLKCTTENFFLWLHYMDPHIPYFPDETSLRHFRDAIPPKSKIRELMSRLRQDPDSLEFFTADELELCIDLYDAEVRSTDQSIDDLLVHLKNQKIYDGSLIIVTADHGEELGEHGSLSHGKRISSIQNGRVQIKLYDELLHVPMMIRFPQAEHARRRVNSLISLADLPATIADLLGVQQPETWIGRSFLPLILAGQAARSHVFSSYAVRQNDELLPVVSCRTETWKYIHDGVFGRHELYNLSNDPGEQKNVFERHPGRASGLRSRILGHLAQFPEGTMQQENAERDEALMTRLQKLGYMTD